MILKNHVPEFQTTAVHCPICPCKILLAGKSVKTTKESIPICPKLETADGIKYWKVDEMMVFENIGFTKTDGLNQSLRYLCCADCDLGPLGFNVIGEKECYVAADRVRYAE